jgi:peptide/nickel transport system substrate-binding protein
MQRIADLVVSPKGYDAIGAIVWLAFNHKHEILKDKRVRQAIAYAIDRDFINKALHSGFSSPALGPIAMGSPLADQDAYPYDLDLDKAKRMLDEAGYPEGADGMRFKLRLDTLISQRDIAEYLRPQLRRVGIDVELRIPPDFPTWSRWISNHEFDMTVDNVFNWGDPVIGVHRTYLCSNIRPGVIWSNTQSYCNPRVDELLEAAGQEMDPDRRRELYLEFQRIVTDELPVYWMFAPPFHSVYTSRMGNPPETIWGAMAPMDEVYLRD